ncbi:GGDEF domain-containing protein [Imhoffiella purpurea]|uniref:diguanylate cyclase n=1 Tax=Imhoffiella purpurea TaxID=1249627 RepID=W9VBF2_9GAMM|nr:GGDEF domain-containing protein [Imhoffiella purpurea]EXJ13352.1 Transcriptional regulatory protein [Imhoffiella purpurea]
MTAKGTEFLEDMRTASDYLRMAVPLMVQRQIPPTPVNYALWYAHVRNADPELSRALLEQFPGTGCYAPEKTEALFFEHILKSYLPQDPRIQNLLLDILARLVHAVSASVEGARDYEGTLKDALQVLNVEMDNERVQEVLDQLLSETVALQNLNRGFQGELESASQEVRKLKKELEETQQVAMIDALTKIPNRRAFNTAILQSLSMADEPTSLMLLDIDHFKRCNDTYGHPMGDRVLEILGGLLAGFQSESLFVARYGGEEFAVVVNDDLAAALAIAEDIRQKVARMRIKRKNSQEAIGAVTLSVGVAQAWPEESLECLIERADKALYRAKSGGRNLVVADESPPESPDRDSTEV